jgi:hypothetical protein
LQRHWNSKTERLRGLEVDGEFDFRGLLNRQIGWLFALENPAGIDAGQAVCVSIVGPVAQQPPSRSEVAPVADRGYSVTNSQLRALAADLVRSQVSVIATASTPAALAAKAATTNIPIVFEMAGDPVRLGLVASLDHPGGNVTGVTNLYIEVVPKVMQLLREVVPNARVFALYWSTQPILLLPKSNRVKRSWHPSGWIYGSSMPAPNVTSIQSSQITGRQARDPPRSTVC